ncbi:uncharacterized protein LOC130419235 [Triplophysa dalaica]|uniref:uncharacterized protein LOC130419235 n=1 Tax=Triplophysa dalaica TaxID=1582913 RepID=UPI0024DF3836|nr:uncharacterized protein LOC130419235 [Triplophysa dalaica]
MDQMKPSKNRKCEEKTTSLKTQVESQIWRNRLRQTVRKYYGSGKTTMEAGNSNDLTHFPSQEGNALSKCPVCFSSLKLCHTSELLQCTQCPTAPFLCGSCLYPCTTDSATCTNNMCPLVSTLLTCGLVSDPKSKVFECPEFRACPKCRSLIIHVSGCKFVRCHSCKHRFCFICLQDDCCNDVEKYWSLTCKKPRAQRQRFILTS